MREILIILSQKNDEMQGKSLNNSCMQEFNL